MRVALRTILRRRHKRKQTAALRDLVWVRRFGGRRWRQVQLALVRKLAGRKR